MTSDACYQAAVPRIFAYHQVSLKCVSASLTSLLHNESAQKVIGMGVHRDVCQFVKSTMQ